MQAVNQFDILNWVLFPSIQTLNELITESIQPITNTNQIYNSAGLQIEIRFWVICRALLLGFEIIAQWIFLKI